MTNGIERVHTEKGVPPLGPYSQAIKANGFVFLSGQIPAYVLDDKVEIVDGPIAEQAHVMFRNARAVLEAAGSGLEKVVRATLYLADLRNIEEVNQIYAEYFPKHPARSCMEATRLPAGMSMEIDLIALA